MFIYREINILMEKLNMNIPEKLATQDTQDEVKQNKNTTYYVLSE